MIVWARYDEKGEINYCKFSVPSEEQQEEDYTMYNQTWQPKDMFDMLVNDHQIQYTDPNDNIAIFKIGYNENADVHDIVVDNIDEIIEDITEVYTHYAKNGYNFEDFLEYFQFLGEIKNIIDNIMKQYKQQFDYDYHNAEFLNDSKAQIESRKKIKEMQPYYRTDFDIPDATPDDYMDRLLDRYYDQLPIWH